MAANKLYSSVILRGVRTIALITFFLLIFSSIRMVFQYYNEIYGKGMHIIFTISFSFIITSITYGHQFNAAKLLLFLRCAK